MTLPELRQIAAEREVALIRAALRHRGGHLQPAARDLAVSYSQLYRLVHERYAGELEDDATTALGRPARSPASPRERRTGR